LSFYRTVGDDKNPWIAVYEKYTVKELKTENGTLQIKENLLIQQQLVAAQTSAGKLSYSYRCDSITDL
jgi:hypothetical protein